MRSVALGREPILFPHHLERSLSKLGDVDRLRHKLQAGQPIQMAAIGASNCVRGGCHPLQQKNTPCADAHLVRMKSDGTRFGWLVQAFDAFNRTWPHALQLYGMC